MRNIRKYVIALLLLMLSIFVGYSIYIVLSKPKVSPKLRASSVVADPDIQRKSNEDSSATKRSLRSQKKWKSMGLDTFGNYWSVDPESVLIDGDTRTFWAKVRYEEPKTVREGKTYSFVKSKTSINCAKGTFSNLGIQGLDLHGNPGEYIEYEGLPKYTDQPITPNTAFDSMRNYVCSIKESAE